MPAILIGLAAGAICFFAVNLKFRLGYDDSLDVVGVHMVGGLIGVLLTGVFASLAVNAAGQPGGLTQLGRQAVLAVAGIVYPFVMTWIILWVTDKTVGLQVDPEEEEVGLDLGEHGEPAYDVLPASVLEAAGMRSNGGAAASGAADGGGADSEADSEAVT
jgi:Amt family ammonium transporter